MEKKHLKFITGFKGALCLLVLLHHFALLFFPVLVNGIGSKSRLPYNIEKEIINSPFNILGYGGALAVALFFIISGFLITYNFYNKSYDKESIAKKTVGRYIQLFIPVFISSIYAYLLVNIFNKLGLFNIDFLVERSYYTNINFDFINLLYESLIATFSRAISTFNPPLWTMSSELFGSLLILLVLFLFGKNKNRYYLYILLMFIFLNSSLFYFILGLILGDLYVFKNHIFNKTIKFWHKLIILIFTIILCGYTYLNSTTTIYSNLGSLLNYNVGIDSVVLSRYLGSTLLFVLILSSKLFKKIFSSVIFTKLGDYSLEIYIFHWPILYTIILLIVSIINRYSHNYIISSLIGLIIFIICVLIISFLYKRTVSQKISSFEKFITNKL